MSHDRSVPGLWSNRTFSVLFAAQAISLAGSGVTTIALTLFAYRIAGPAAATSVLGQALMLRILAFLIFSQPAGILADRLNRKFVLIVSDLARFGLMALFPFITSIWQVYVTVFAVNALTAFFSPTFEASLPEIVGKDQYVKALAYSRVTVDIEAVGGPALAALLLLVVSLRWVFWFDAITYLASAALVSTVQVPGPRGPGASLSPGVLLKELTHGTRVLLREPSIRQALVMSMAGAVAGACAIVVTIAYVRDLLGRSDSAFTLLMVGVGVGSSLAAVILSRVTASLEHQTDGLAPLHGLRHRWASYAILMGGAVATLSLLPGIFRPPIFVFGMLWIANGAAQALIEIPSATLVAEHTSVDERGRAYAALFAITHAFWLFTYPATGYLARVIGADRTFTVCGIACLLIGLLAVLVGRGAQGSHLHIELKA
jgi:NRE family putative nickel resistance protein-like MFS transporter